MKTLAAITGLCTALFTAEVAAAPDIAPGTYRCFVYLNRIPNVVGMITLDGQHYAVQGREAKGSYSSRGGVTTFNGPPPMGFAAAAPVADQPGRFRLYPDTASVGKAWKAALCSPAQ